MSTLTEKIIFKLNLSVLFKIRATLRNLYYRTAGMKIGNGTFLERIAVTWPHQVAIGSNCRLEHDIYFHFDGIHKPGPSIIIGDNSFVGFGCEFNITKKITIGTDCLIASGTKFIDHDHGMALDTLMRKQKSPESEIVIGDNVWLGVNVVVLKGVTIGRGAVVAAGAVVTKSIPENEIWGGIPAKRISERK
ncbi:MAG: DapH/DapD/GlmU-related protein [Bacteroidia bacterium]